MEAIFFPQRTARDPAEIGGKASALATLQRAGLPVPPWFALVPDALSDCLSETGRRAFRTARGADAIRAALEAVKVNGRVEAELAAALLDLCPNHEYVAVRSSAIEEDGQSHSSAGQLESFLFVKPADVAANVVAVWRSAFSDRVLAYRRERGLHLLPKPPAVLIQRMVNPDAAGVAFGADPVTGRRRVVVITAVHGLGNALASGACDADTYYADRQGRILQTDVPRGPSAERQDATGVKSSQREALRASPVASQVLKADQIEEVARLTRAAAVHMGRPQDIEWAIEDGKLHLLQSRPITSLAGMADPDGVLALWDNSNIAESYGGITTPLTFSFARQAYEEVYRQFCRIMGVRRATIDANARTLHCMLGLIRGRVYYNLLNWYRVLALLPGFTVNRPMMEQMMGVKEGLPETVLAELGPVTAGRRSADMTNLAFSLVGLTNNYLRLQRKIGRFSRRLDEALDSVPTPLDSMELDELALHYHRLEGQLLTRWDAPLINDFFAMIFFGALRRLVTKWCGDGDGTLQNDLLSGQGGMISAEPVARMRALAEIAHRRPHFVSLLCDGPLDEILAAMRELPDFEEGYRGYLERFGDRCFEELKLESLTLQDEPLRLLRSVGRLATHSETIGGEVPDGHARTRAEETAKLALAGSWLRRRVFNWVLANARARIRDRENLRFSRTRVFARVRRVFIQMGRRFHALGLLDEPRDIFYLELEEVLGFVDGTATSTELRSLARLRRQEFGSYHAEKAPAERFETRGAVHQGNLFEAAARVASTANGSERVGIGCCPGIVRGPVRVIEDPRTAETKPGEILVARRTDPGWIVLFPAAAGLLVERGSLLSHSAILARELRLPTVVSIGGLMEWLKDGEVVQFDGSTGVVRKVGA